MRIAHRLGLLLALALAALAVAATAAFATSAQVDTTETATVITVATATGLTGGQDPSGNYTAHSTNASLTSGLNPTIVCDSDATFTIDVTGDGAITQLEYSNCNNDCVVNDTSTSSSNTTPVTITDGGFTVTGATTSTSQATFVLDGSDGRADISGTVVCGALNLDCRFTLDTGNTNATVFAATVDEGAPAHLTFLNATVAGDTIVTCSNPDLTATYTLDDPTTAGTDDVTISP